MNFVSGISTGVNFGRAAAGRIHHAPAIPHDFFHNRSAMWNAIILWCRQQ